MSDAKPIILMHRRGSTLVPHGPLDEELVRSFDTKHPLRVRITQARNPRSLRLYFAMVSLVRDNLPEPAPSIETLHRAILVMLGYTLTVHTQRGDVVLPGSVAFDKMSEPEFHAYLEAFKQLVITRIIPNLDAPAFERAARDMMGDPLDPAQRRHAERGPAPAESPGAYVEDDEDEEDGVITEGAHPADITYNPATGKMEVRPVEDDDDPRDDFGPARFEARHDPALDTTSAPDASATWGTPEDVPPHLAATIRDLAERTARTKRPRELPPGLSQGEATIWFAAYDAIRGPYSPEDDPAADDSGPPREAKPAPVSAKMATNLAPGEMIDPQTGEVTTKRPRSKPRGPLAISGQNNDLPTEHEGLPATEGEQASDRSQPISSDSPASGDGVALVSISHPDVEFDATTDWPSLKRLYRERLPRYVDELEPEGVRMFKHDVWERSRGFGIIPDTAGDYDLMWLWLECGATTYAEIEAMWFSFWRSRAYTGASPEEQSAIAGLMVERQKELRK